MSTKTLRKRIALVAVSALGAGLLSVVAVPSANAAVGDGASYLYIGKTASTTGEGSASHTLASSTQTGFVSPTAGTAFTGGYGVTGGSAGSAVVLAGAQIPVLTQGTSASATGISFVATGGSLVSISASVLSGVPNGSIGAVSVNGSGTVAQVTQSGTTAASLAALFKVTAAAGTTATISAYAGTGVTGTTSATNGSLVGIWTFTVAPASTSGVYSAADSSIFQQAAVAKGTAATGTNAYDTSSRIGNGKVGVIYWSLKDQFLSPVTTGVVAATATNSATLNVVDTAGAADAYGATTSFDSLAAGHDGSGYIVVNQPVANTAGTTTVTITNDGAVIATKTLNWAGDIATLTVDTANSVGSFINGQTADTTNQQSGVVYVAKDAAGNALTLTAHPTISSPTGALVGATVSTFTDTTSGVLQTSSVGYGTVTMIVPESTLNGAGTYKLKITNAAGVVVYSPVVSATVSNGSLNSFSASWDKASYAPGEIAVLTIQGKDVYGNLIGDGTAATGLSLTVAGSATAGFTSVGTACSATSAFSSGVITCKFAANTEGAWSYSVDVTTATPQSASVGALKITSGGGVSNADVLKAIVSLIASINKQIAALQKALLKK